MANKNCLVYETLGKVSELQMQSDTKSNEVRLSGVFGVCGIRNNNRRVYNKQNYGLMVEALQKVIKTEGCPGELEHPNSMNITLENVSHKIESIEMKEDGTITGTILLLNTPKGQIAKAIVEGGLPLYISSRGAGSIDDSGNVTLSSIKTYDLVGTPGFSQAKLSLKENQTYECLNESMEDGNIMYAIVENDEFGHSTKEKSAEKSAEKSEDKSGDKSEDKSEDKSDDKSDDKSTDKSEDKSEDKSDDKPEEKTDEKTNKDKIDMEDLKKSIEQLTSKIEKLEANLHITTESLEDVKKIDNTNYKAIQEWVVDEFGKEIKEQISEDINESVKEYIVEKFAPGVQEWVCNEFAPTIEKWINEEYTPNAQQNIVEMMAPAIEKWTINEFAPKVQGWITEEYSPKLQEWITEEFAPEVENWIKEEYTPENNQMLENKINTNINAFLESKKEDKFSGIDKMIESLEKLDNTTSEQAINMLHEAQQKDDKYNRFFAINNMPNQYRVQWEMLSEAKKEEIARQSKMYDFTKPEILESFWAGINFNENLIKENKKQNNISQYHNSIFSTMAKLRK